MSETARRPDYRLVTFNRRCLCDEEIEHLTSLHAELLPRSPVVLLGRRFMEGFFYRFLPVDGHIAGVIVYVDEKPAGFITAAPDAAGFMKAVLRRHWPRIGWLVGVSVIGAPGRLAGVREALRVNSGLTKTPDLADTGELLSLGVLPLYRAGSFIRRTGFRLADDLLETALLILRETGVRRVRAVVDSDNIEAGLFYRGRGWEPSGNEAKGWSTNTVEYTLDIDSVRVNDRGPAIRSCTLGG